jgi:hypothetical protein
MKELHLVPDRLPARFWALIDAGIMTEQAARVEWARREASGELFEI